MTTIEILAAWKLIEIIIWVSPFIAKLSGN